MVMTVEVLTDNTVRITHERIPDLPMIVQMIKGVEGFTEDHYRWGMIPHLPLSAESETNLFDAINKAMVKLEWEVTKP